MKMPLAFLCGGGLRLMKRRGNSYGGGPKLNENAPALLMGEHLT